MFSGKIGLSRLPLPLKLTVSADKKILTQRQAIPQSQCKLNIALVGVLQCELQLTAVDSPHNLHPVIVA